MSRNLVVHNFIVNKLIKKKSELSVCAKSISVNNIACVFWVFLSTHSEISIWRRGIQIVSWRYWPIVVDTEAPAIQTRFLNVFNVKHRYKSISPEGNQYISLLIRISHHWALQLKRIWSIPRGHVIVLQPTFECSINRLQWNIRLSLEVW